MSTLLSPGGAPAAPEAPQGRAPVENWSCMDGNEAAASVAHRLSEVCAIYPITPASPMGELADIWTAKGRRNIWGRVPKVIEMQSEGGAAGTLHGAIQAGALATSFTSSQGLLLMLPTMYKVAGELTPTVLHVAARALATHALSIFGDHSDVMAARSTGWAMLASTTVQEAHDLAAVAHASTLLARVPFVHFFDGFRTSHEVARIHTLTDDHLRQLIDDDAVLAHGDHAMRPTRPVLRGTAQNPDVFFQGREASNRFYDATPGLVQSVMDKFARIGGRDYHLVEYHGAPDAERVVIAMGSAVSTIAETVNVLAARGEKVGLINVRLYRPFPAEALLAALPASTKVIAVLDRCKEPGAVAEPLHLDVVASLAGEANPPAVIGGRYGLGSKEFFPRDAAAVFAELGELLAGRTARRRFTVGITDDVTGLSLEADRSFRVPTTAVQAVFYGLGSDGTVGANKASVKLIGENTHKYVQGYFVYDSKKSGSTTVSHLRFGDDPIESPYLIEAADFVSVQQFGLLKRLPVLDVAKPGATVLVSSPHPSGETWQHMPTSVRRAIVSKGLRVVVVDAAGVARDVGLGNRINTVMQACFFALADVLPVEHALLLAKDSARRTYAKRGAKVVQANLDAIDNALAAMHPLVIPDVPTWDQPAPGEATDAAPADVDASRRLIGRLIRGEGDSVTVGEMPVDGSFPTGTAKLEKRGLAVELPLWDASLCIDCGKCTLACPHAAIRMKTYEPNWLDAAPNHFMSKDTMGRDFPPGTKLTVQLAPDDCTGCSICVSVCPARSRTDLSHKALNMVPAGQIRVAERASFEHFLSIPETDRTSVRTETVKGSQLLQPLFEFSGACTGCGETPYIKLVSQLLGDRMIVANATGCSSIFGGNLPTTPWTVDAEGRGPSWSNSLFEDNAEFGMGLQLGTSGREEKARALLVELAPALGVPAELVDDLLVDVPVTDERAVAQQRERVGALRRTLNTVDASLRDSRYATLVQIADALVPTSVWVIGGDGWAYDIGFGGLDHLFSTGQNINVLVLDSEVYSNTGGQASKATPRGASAKFAASGKPARKKDLGMLAQAYGNVYVAQVAMNANETQAVRAVLEAAAYPGPSLIIAYSTCIAHGMDMANAAAHQKAAVTSGHWPLYRFHPEPEQGKPSRFRLDSKPPSTPLADFYATETRYASVTRADPERAAELVAQAQVDAYDRWARYERLSGA